MLEARSSGTGQVVDAAMVDGSAVLINFIWGLKTAGMWGPERGTNLLDTGAPFYDVYECADGTYVSIGSLEPQFYAELKRLAELDDDTFGDQHNTANWPVMKERIAEIFESKTRAEWCEIMEHTDVCFAPVLSMEEASEHPHNVARGTFIDNAGMTQAGPAPRFSRTEPAVRGPLRAAHVGQHTDEVLADFGFGPHDVASLKASGAVV